jgi:acyl dehydratase
MATEIRELDGAPGVMGNYLKAFGSALPLAGRLPMVPGGGGSELPDLELRVPRLETDPTHLAAYAKVCGFALRDTLPATYLNVRAFPVHIALMTDPAFPFGPVGLVHLTNEITQRRPVAVSEALSLRVWVTGLDPHPKGRTLTLHTEAKAGDEVVWEARSTMLRRGGGDESAKTAHTDPGVEIPTAATWTVPGDTGRRYAAVSGDRNPIHLYGITAKAFGFPRAIAHGLWTKARALAALDGRLPDAFTVAVTFRKPLLLPAKVDFGSAQDGDVLLFQVRDARKGSVHLDGSVTPLGAKTTPAAEKPAAKKPAASKKTTTASAAKKPATPKKTTTRRTTK